jgi:hypothetical protein
MKKILLVLCSLAVFPLSAQVGNITYIQQLAQKPRAQYSDAVRLFVLQSNRQYTSFSQGVGVLKKDGILPDKTYSENDPLRRGFVALLASRYFSTSDSVMYSIFGTERYAYVSCVSLKLMEGGRSEWDYLSGSELIEIMSRVSARMEDRNEK